MKRLILVSCILGSVGVFAVPNPFVNNKADNEITAKVMWSGGATVAVQRSVGESGEWETIGTSDSGEFVDEKAPYGLVCSYRIAEGEETSDTVTFRRLRRIDTTGATFFTNGTVYKSRVPANAFDNDPGYDPKTKVYDANHIFEVSESPSQTVKLGVDFGSPRVCVSYIRMYPRNTYTVRMRGLTLYGSSDPADVSVKAGIAEDVKLTEALVLPDGNPERWYDLTVAEPGVYRTYYAYNIAENANVGELELYGWLAEDVGPVVKPLELTVERSDYVDSYADLSWEIDEETEEVTVERKIADGEWTAIGTSSSGFYQDMTMPYGKEIQYRLVHKGVTSSAQRFLRMHRLSTSGYSIFSNATEYWNDQREDRAFDGVWEVAEGDCMSYPDITTPNHYPKVGVDFGAATHYVAMVRMYPRTQSNQLYLMNDAVVYGSKRSGVIESQDDILGTQVTTKAGGVDEARWYELTAIEAPIKAYRTYYYYHVTGGCANECEFYGWTRDDLDEKVPLEFTVTRNNLNDFYPVLTWNDIALKEARLERSSDDGKSWTGLATFAPGDEPVYTDSKVKYGLPYLYRLVYDETTSETLSFRRLRKFTPAQGELFSNADGMATPEEQHGPQAAFDGVLSSGWNVDVFRNDDRSPKVGIDFGQKNVALALVRVYPRNDGYGPNSRISSDVIVYASDKTADEESSTTDNAVPVTSPTVFGENDFNWQERSVEMPDYYRTYYYTGCWRASVNEIEFYGWYKSDIVRPFIVTIR